VQRKDISSLRARKRERQRERETENESEKYVSSIEKGSHLKTGVCL